MPALSLPQRRYLLLLEQLLDEAGGPRKHGARTAAGKRLGISQSHVTQLLEGSKVPGQDIIERAVEKLRIRREFFHDEATAMPDYRSYRRGHERERVERDAELGYPVVEEYIAAQAAAGQPVTDEHQAELRDLRRASGPEGLTHEMVRGYHRGLIARDARRALEEPLVDAEIDVQAGQRARPKRKR